ncbi:hypothetical protein LXL04_021603 [Taraxacum kok-saghyz]
MIDLLDDYIPACRANQGYRIRWVSHELRSGSSVPNRGTIAYPVRSESRIAAQYRRSGTLIAGVPVWIGNATATKWERRTSVDRRTSVPHRPVEEKIPSPTLYLIESVPYRLGEENIPPHQLYISHSFLYRTTLTEVNQEVDQEANQESHQEIEMNVSDPDFYDFNLERTERSFQENQVWACYDDDDGMPRFYALIHKVWTVYRNWCREWGGDVPDEVVHKYDMVEVLEDYDEEKRVLVSRLSKHAGFRTVFIRDDDVMVVVKEEMFRFSHLVPRYVLTGSEGQNCPVGCLELDPTATPLDLINDNGMIGNE